MLSITHYIYIYRKQIIFTENKLEEKKGCV